MNQLAGTTTIRLSGTYHTNELRCSGTRTIRWSAHRNEMNHVVPDQAPSDGHHTEMK
jgi:hypothetical protein